MVLAASSTSVSQPVLTQSGASVSVGGSRPSTCARDLIALTGGKRFEVESTTNLGATFLSVLQEFRQRYLVSYSPRGVSNTGWHQIERRIRGRNATVKARPGYMAGS